MEAQAGHEHLDEGLIHAWLDGALSEEVAAEVQARADGCAECAARVAEARGLVAGASRVVSALDAVPAATGTAWGTPPVTPTASGGGSVWRMLRVTPARAAIAATILVGIGITLTRDRVADEQGVALRSMDTAQAAATPAPPIQDSLLQKAIARTMADANPPRAVKAAPGAAVSVPPPAVAARAATEGMLPNASEAVAAGKASAMALRDTAEPGADKLRARVRAPAAAFAGGASAPASLAVPAPQCLRITSLEAKGWPMGEMPFVVRLEGAGVSGVEGEARILEAAGVRATWHRAGGDSVHVELRRAGDTGAISLAPAGDRATRTGIARSGGTSVRVAAATVACPME